MQATIINIKGMTCMGCVRSIKNVLEKIPGVSSAEVSLEDAQVTIQFDATIVSNDQFKQAIEEAGFEAII
ncbi:heavy-metal-associated domain-containing protein [Nitrosomonas sp. Nm132]|jgi:copper chaperone|uniref:heavy-metal-associated domain-containing protein n=1 Tax=Nitrosomonas sp. Nm132 TaxID=1881053 RepID=UPI000881A443|nr:heavy metal-associated domain-containing protein [Nitrosomonas sp. Nm132]SDG90402.1 copper chaperone [Nitrosomonas sp. Nm132]